MRFWDASAIVPLLMQERHSRFLRSLAAKDPTMLVWWASEVECISALARLERDGTTTADILSAAFGYLRRLVAGWQEIEPSDALRETASRFLRVHALRAANALQLAAAFVAAERRPTSLELVTLDERLAAAAQKEGFLVMQISAAD
jgi:predicted nucleic acid-binding protein